MYINYAWLFFFSFTEELSPKFCQKSQPNYIPDPDLKLIDLLINYTETRFFILHKKQ